MVHYRFVFKGYLNRTIKFDGTSSDRHFQEKADGYLYINGERITNKKDAIRTIYYNSDDGNLSLHGDAWVDCTFAIDSEGNVICESSRHSGSKFNRFMDWITGSL